MKRLLIWMEGGVIRDMDIPEGIIVEVRDYDVEGVDIADGYDLDVDHSGDAFVRTTWGEEGVEAP